MLSATGGIDISDGGKAPPVEGGKEASATGGRPGAVELLGTGGRVLSATGGRDMSPEGGGRAPVSRAPLSRGRAFKSPGRAGAAAKGWGEDGNSDWGGNVGEPGLLGLPSGKGGRDKSPEEGAGEVVDAPGSEGRELSVPAGGGKALVSAGPEGGSAGKPELSGGSPGAVLGGWLSGAELSVGRAGAPESGAPVDGKGGKPELSDGEAGAAGGNPLGAELSPGKGGSPDEGLLSVPGSGGAAFSLGLTG